MIIRFYFSFRSPFAGVAFHRMSQLPEPVRSIVQAMPLWPDVIFGGHMDNPTDNLFKLRYVFKDAARQAEKAGLNRSFLDRLDGQFQLDEATDYQIRKVGTMTGIEQWQPVHLAYLSAVDAGLGWQFGNAVFARRFDFDSKGRLDVMQQDVIEKICQDMTLDIPLSWTETHRKKLDKICASGVRRSELDGVFGVPFFVLEDDGVEEYFWGNDRIDWLLEAAGITSGQP